MSLWRERIVAFLIGAIPPGRLCCNITRIDSRRRRLDIDRFTRRVRPCRRASVRISRM